MVDFGEYSNDVYLVPYEGLVDTSDYDNLETGRISICLTIVESIVEK